MFLFIFERERQSMSKGGAERGRHRIQSRLQALSCQHRAWHRAQTHQPWDHNPTLNWLSHPGAPHTFFSSAHGNILQYRPQVRPGRLNRFEKIGIIQSIFSNHSATKLEISKGRLPCHKVKKRNGRGSVKRPTPDFSSGHHLTVSWVWALRQDLHWQRGASLWFSLSLSLCPSHTHSLFSLSLSK